MKRFLALAIILGFVGGGILSFSAMHHDKDGVTSGNCPVSALPVSLCPSDALSAATHYLSMYQAFTTAVASSIVVQVLAAALLFIVIAYRLRRHLTQITGLFRLSHNFVAKLYRPQALTRWLSLLVNSPSII